MPVRLTEALLDSLTPSDRDQFLFDSLLPTFGYRLTPKGRGILFVGKPRRTVGYRPPLKVAPAREQAHAMLVDIRQGRDPVVERKARAARVAAGTMTVVQLAEKWLANYVRPKLKPRTVEDY
jgi:Arm DNA-binding domain